MEVELHGNRLRVYKNGNIEKWKSYPDPIKNKWKLIKQSNHTDGYKCFQLRCDGKDKLYLVHRVVGFAYLVFDINDSKIPIDHIDRNRSNNHIDNLRLSDPLANPQNRNVRGTT